MSTTRFEPVSEGDLDAEMKRYFDSITEAFRREIDRFTARPPIISSIKTFFIAGTVFPLIPFLVWLSMGVFHPADVWVEGIFVPAHSFIFWWIGLAVLCIGLAFLFRARNEGEPSGSGRRSMPAAQLRFACAFAVMQEAERYRISGLDEAYRNIGIYYRQCIKLLGPFFSPRRRPFAVDGPWPQRPNDDAIVVYMNELSPSLPSSFLPQVIDMADNYPWFKLADNTRKIVDAFDILPGRLGDRILDRKDLRPVRDVFYLLARYFYTVIPDIGNSSDIALDMLQQKGETALAEFADAIILLPPYEAERRVLAPQVPLRRRIGRRLLWIAALFTSSNPLFRFLAWFFLGIGLVLSSVNLLLHYYPMKMDSTLMSICITAPLGLAAAALALARRDP